MELFFEALKGIIGSIFFNDEVSLQDLVDRGDQALKVSWDGCNHATAGKDFYDLVIKGFFDTTDYQMRILTKKNPQKYIKLLVDKPIYLDESSDIDTSVTLLQTLRLYRLVGKTLAIIPIDRTTQPGS